MEDTDVIKSADMIVEQSDEETDKEAKREYIKKIILASKLIHMWPNENRIPSFIYNLLAWTIIINSSLFVLGFFIYIGQEYGNVDGVTQSIDFVTVFISATFRYTYVYVRGKKYVCLVQRLHNRFIHYPFFSKTASLDEYYKTANRIIIAYICFTVSWILQMFTVPIITYIKSTREIDFSADGNVTEVPFPIVLNMYVPFALTNLPINIFYYLYQVVTFLNFGLIYLTVDSFWYMVILLTIGQFNLVKVSLNTLKEISEADDEAKQSELMDKAKTQNIEKGVIKCIKHHQFLREFVRDVDDLCNPNTLVDSLHAIISIAFILLDATIGINKGEWNKVLYSFQYFVTSIVHMFVFDWLANELSLKEEELAEAIYDVSWYRCPGVNKSCTMIIVQSRRPYKLTGGKMYQLSLEFFASTVKAIFSYFTFLFQLRNKNTDDVL